MGELVFLEAKKGAPNPDNGNGEEFDAFIDDIAGKYRDSFGLWLTLALGRRIDAVSEVIQNCDLKTENFKFILVIKTHEEEWLLPVMDILNKKMQADRKIWNCDIAVLNEETAKKKGLIRSRVKKKQKRKEKVLRCAGAYELTPMDIEITKKALQRDYMDLQVYYEGGA